MNNLNKIVSFLCGESDFNGLWFGEKALSQNKFWWREDLRNALVEVETELTELRKEREWISTEGRLPEYGQPVILKIKSTVQHVTYMRDGGDDEPDWFEPFHYDDKEHAFFIHKEEGVFWQPLPPANKDKDNG